MDKYTYSLKVEKIQKLVRQEEYAAAAKIADTIEWDQEHNVRLLTAVAEAYEKSGQYSQAIEVLLTAYEHSAIGKRIMYKLTELALTSGKLSEAETFYKKYLEEAPDENNRYILRYLIAEAKGEDLDKRITILETYKKYEFEEEWAYRLAELYQKAGREKDCVALCDEIILWFGIGKYVDKAMELKETYEPLTAAQKERRENREFYEAKVQEVADEMAEVVEQKLPAKPEPEEPEEEAELPEDDDIPSIVISKEVADAPLEDKPAEPQKVTFANTIGAAVKKMADRAEAAVAAAEKAITGQAGDDEDEEDEQAAGTPAGREPGEEPEEKATAREEAEAVEALRASVGKYMSEEPEGADDKAVKAAFDFAEEETGEALDAAADTAEEAAEAVEESAEEVFDAAGDLAAEAEETVEEAAEAAEEKAEEVIDAAEDLTAEAEEKAEEAAEAAEEKAEEVFDAAEDLAAEAEEKAEEAAEAAKEKAEEAVEEKAEEVFDAAEDFTAEAAEEVEESAEEAFDAAGEFAEEAGEKAEEVFDEAEEAEEEAAGTAEKLGETQNLKDARSLKDILRSTLGFTKKSEDSEEPTKEIVIPREYMSEEEKAGEETPVVISREEPAAEEEIKLSVDEPEVASLKEISALTEEFDSADDLVPEEPAGFGLNEIHPEEAEKKPGNIADGIFSEAPVHPHISAAEALEKEVVSTPVRPAPEEEPLDTPFDDGTSAAQSPLATDSSVLPVISFEETEKAVWEDQNRRLNEIEPLESHEMEHCIFISTASVEDGVNKAVEALEEYYHTRDMEVGPIAKIRGEKLNRRGLEKSLPQLTNKDLIIDEANGIDDKIIREMLSVMDELDPDKVFVLMDSPENVDTLKQRIRGMLMSSDGRTAIEPKETAKKTAAEEAEREEARPAEKPQKRPRKVKRISYERMNREQELSDRDFMNYAVYFAKQLECVIDESGLDALEDEIAEIREDGAALTAGEVEDIIEDAADHANRTTIRRLFSPKYDKDGFLILRNRDFQ